MSVEDSSRRRFFRQFVDRTLGTTADYVGARFEGLVGRPCTRLRPPGAIAEAAFLDTCYRCGNCVDICPARAIRHIRQESETLDGTPVILPDDQPCVVCDDLPCMTVCPSGALQVTPRERIRMGMARVDPEACLRAAGEMCTECVDLCPQGEGALRIDAGGDVEVIEGGCIGCGLCQWRCPPVPKAIAVDAR